MTMAVDMQCDEKHHMQHVLITHSPKLKLNSSCS